MVDSKIASILSSETKAKISKTMTGRKFTKEHRANLSLAKKNSKGITVLNLATKEETNHTSISQAENYLVFLKVQ